MGLPPISTIGLGRISVSSANRVPKPPASTATFILTRLLVEIIGNKSVLSLNK